jgi:hypothetical protein
VNVIWWEKNRYINTLHFSHSLHRKLTFYVLHIDKISSVAKAWQGPIAKSIIRMNLRREGLRFISSLISWIQRYMESHSRWPLPKWRKKNPIIWILFSASNQTQFDSRKQLSCFLFSSIPQASRRGIKRWRDGPFSLINYSNLIKSPFGRENGQRWLYTNSDDFNGHTGWKLLAFIPLISWPSNKEHENEKIIKCNIATLNIEPCPNFLIIDVI